MKINFYATVCSLYALAVKANNLERATTTRPALEVEHMLAETMKTGSLT